MNRCARGAVSSFLNPRLVVSAIAVWACCYSGPAAAQTVLTASDGASLVTALTTVDNNPGTSYRINITSNITLNSGTTLPAINTTSPLVISGGNFTINGGGVQQGFFVYSGNVSITNLAITNTQAVGGGTNMSWGGGGGGGAGAGGALFVAAGAKVAVNNVNFSGNNASGGNGGTGVAANSTGGPGGGLDGGTGGATAFTIAGGGGGGVGRGANGGNAAPTFAGGTSGGSGIIIGAGSGGNGSGHAVGASAGPGGPGGGGGGGGAGFGAGGGGGVNGASASMQNGGNGGFGGGGGSGNGSYNGGLPGPSGAGGFGGGGGGGSINFPGANGGFGGGGGGAGSSNGTQPGGTGGFGGGAGGNQFTGNQAAGGGGGGAGLGGAIFVQQGGTLTIAGPLTVNGNSVTAGTGGTSDFYGALAGANGSAYGSGIFLQGNGTLNFQPGKGHTQTISDVIADQTGSGGTGANAGSWGLNVSGGGTLILTGNDTYSGSTSVTGATLVVNGSITDPTVNAGGVLMGTGSVGPTQINAGGTFAPGSGTPGTSMTVNGSLAFASGAIYAVYLNSTTSSFATVTGPASLAGTVQANFASGSYVPKQYLILTASGGISGAFSGVSNVNLPGTFADTLSYSGNNVYLDLVPGIVGVSGLPANQQNVANTLINYFNTTGGLPAVFFGVTPSGLMQLDGEVSADAEIAVFQMMNEFLGLMLDPFVDGRLGGFGGSGNGGGGAIGFAPEQQAFLPEDVALAYASILNKAPPPPPFTQRWTSWGAAYGGGNWTNGNAAVGSNNVNAQTYGFVAGADYHFSPDTIAGFAVGGGGLSWGLANANGTGRSDAFQAGVYGITRAGPAYISGALAFANQWMTTNRSALGDTITASFAGQSYGARVEGGYRLPVLPVFGVTPYGAVQPQLFRTPSYSETDTTGGGLGLTFASASASDVRTEIGSRFDSPLLIGDLPLILRGRLAWAHDFVNGTALSAAFPTLPGTGFVVNGAPIPQDSALASAGAELFLTPKWTLLVKADGQFASGSQTYAGTGTLRYSW